MPEFGAFEPAAATGADGTRVSEIGTVPAGASATVRVTLRTSAPVRDSQVMWTVAYDGVPQYCFGSVACVLTSVQIRTGPTGTSPVPSAPPTPTQPTLAATGSDDLPLTAAGLGLLLAGVVVSTAGRRRRR